jgi:hypothetical protein
LDELSAVDKFSILPEGRIKIYMRGEIRDGDFDELQRIHFCGCASACAIIWLAAPLRMGSHVIVHRPYFKGGDFSQLPDAVPLKTYEQAAAGVRQLLEDRGYSKEFITKVSSVPQEKGEKLQFDQIKEFPTDAALDELRRHGATRVPKRSWPNTQPLKR